MSKKFSDFTLKNSPENIYIVGFDAATQQEIKISAAALIQRGSAGDSVVVQYSTDGATWHTVFADGDKYMRQKIGSGAWSPPLLIVGENGQDGQDGHDGKDGANGTNGDSVLVGTLTPGAAIGKLGDLYVNSNYGYLYKKTSDTAWTYQGSIRGPQGYQGERGERGEPGSHAQFELIDWDYYTDFWVRNYGNSVNMVYVAYDSFSGRIFFNELDEESDITVTIVNSTKNEIKIRIQKDDYAKQQIQLAPNLNTDYTTPIMLPYEKFIINGHVRNGTLYLF